MEEEITLKKRDLERLRILRQVMDEKMTQVDAGLILGISDR